MSKRYVIMPDVQAPYEDKKAVKAFTRFVGDYQPDELVCIGDLADYPQPSRWSKDTAGEFEGSVFKDSEYIKANILAPIRESYAGRFTFIEGNHDERPRVYLSKYAPALAESGAFDPATLLDFQQFEIEQTGDFYEFAPGWMMTHGHKGGIRLTQTAGTTALNAARRFVRSVIMGHTHRLATLSHTYGYGAKVTKIVTGVEVGNLMDMRQAGYLKGATANWQQGFSVVTVSGQHVNAEIIQIRNRKFTVEGVEYEV